MKQTLQFTLVDYDIENDIEKPTFGNTGKRFVDSEDGWQAFKIKAPALMDETAKYWNFFKDNKYETARIFYSKEKQITFRLTGVPNLDRDESIEEWRSTIEFCIVDKGTHEQFDNAQLWENPNFIIQIFFFP